jgi:hypothetical protein
MGTLRCTSLVIIFFGVMLSKSRSFVSTATVS